MKFSTISILLILSFLMNGCLVNRIKKRVYQNERQQLQENNVTEVVETIQEPVLYTPTPAQPITENKIRTIKKKKKVKKVKKKPKKRVKKSKKRVKKRRAHKIVPEPYSIEKNEADPELLGPQTTLDSNPLERKKGK